MSQTNPRRAASLFICVTVIAAALCLGDTTRAGTVLLSRESNISATGTDGSALSDGSQDFNGFADAVDTADAGVVGPRLTANQHSRPSMDETAGFTGAFAEGSASAEADRSTGDKPGLAVSNFDLTFQVLGAPSLVSFGGSVGVSGDGSTTVELSNESTGEILLAEELLPGDEDGQSIQHSTVLQPGVYELSVEAAANADAGESMAYYTVSLSISALTDDGGGGVTPIPLPAAVWSAVSVLGAGGLIRATRAIRRR
jgi:hypothetical protein